MACGFHLVAGERIVTHFPDVHWQDVVTPENCVEVEVEVEAALGYVFFYRAIGDWLIKPELMPHESEQIVPEVLESVQGYAEVVSALRELKSRGYTMALDVKQASFEG